MGIKFGVTSKRIGNFPKGVEKYWEADALKRSEREWGNRHGKSK